MSSSQAKNIALTTGIDPRLIQFFINLSRPLRTGIKSFLITQKASILGTQRSKLLFDVQSCDVVSNNLQKQRIVIEAILTPNKGLIGNIVNSIPLSGSDSEGADFGTLKLVSDFLNSLIKFLPVKIPSYLGFGTGDTEFFSGVKTYGDLVDKLDDIEYRLVAATSVSRHTANVLTAVDRQLEVIDQWIIMLDAIDGVPLA
ncbi:MAG: hypothetical protein M0R17_01660 [Candidatus Omnitrophica bacterium]|jgi:hypothetical protein|nr:hypothetical protein [Candidatus Omnitrophota bacterium]